MATEPLHNSLERSAPPNQPLLVAADRFLELRPFYRLCWVGLLGTVLCVLLLVAGVTLPGDNMAHRPPVIGVLVAATVAALGASAGALVWRRRTREEQTALAASNATAGPRLVKRRAEIEAQLRIWSGSANAEVGIVANQTALAWTARSHEESRPLVFATVGLLAAKEPPDLARGALAHEAGHIAARDVESFHRLLAALVGAAVMLGLVGLGHPVFLWLRGAEKRIGTSVFFFGVLTTCAVTILAAWSALLVAREIQADAYAVAVTSGDGSVERFLRAAADRAPARSSVAAQLWTWLVQPERRWRATLPAVRGELGLRVETQIGLALGGVLAAWWWAVVFMWRTEPLYPLGFPVLGGAIIYIAWLAFQFSWWRLRASSRRRAASWLAFVLPSSLMMYAMVVFLQIVSHGGIGDRNGPGHNGPDNLLFFSGLVLVNHLVWSNGHFASAWDRRTNADGPGLRTLLIGVGAAVLELVVGFVALTLGGLSHDDAVAVFAAGIAAAVIGFVLLIVGHRRTEAAR